MKRSATPFACGVRIGVRRICTPSLRNTSSNAGGNLVTIPDQKRSDSARSGKRPGELASLLGHPGGVRLGRATDQMHAAAAQMKKST
jgi:hypothetical protein